MPDFKKASAGSNATGFSTMLDRRQLLLGAASAAVGAATLGVTSGLECALHALQIARRSALPARVSSARSGLGDLVKAYNESQDRIMVKFIELPPPSSSTEGLSGGSYPATGPP